MRKMLWPAAAVALWGCVFPWWNGEAARAHRMRAMRTIATVPTISTSFPPTSYVNVEKPRKSRIYRRDTSWVWNGAKWVVRMRGRGDEALIEVQADGKPVFEQRFNHWPGDVEAAHVPVRVRLKAFSRKCGFFLFVFERETREFYALLNAGGDVLAFDESGDCAEGPHFSPSARYLTTCRGLLDLETFSERKFDSQRSVASVTWMGDSLYRVLYDDPSHDLRANAYWYSAQGEERFAFYFNGLDYVRRYVCFASTRNGVHLAFDPEAEEVLVFRASDVVEPSIHSLRGLKPPRKYFCKHVVNVPERGEYVFYTDKAGKLVGADCPPLAYGD
ncbi:MAG: hypothetical protein RMM53_01385 [Bacteroidia bacterium]|nr:hypothetical protein [Bacteroidia bacterium]MDW8332846.1 hypothetical protein [Bacteroidia bacterium]